MHSSAQTHPINFRNLNEMPKTGAKCHECVNRGKQESLPTKDLPYLLNKTLPKLGKGELFREFISLQQCLYCFSPERMLVNFEQHG